MPTYTSPFTGDIVQPTDVSYYQLSFSSNVQLSWPDQTVSGGDTVAAARIMDCFPSTSGLIVNLPPGNQASVGTDILFRNIGSSSFTVQDVNGGQSLVVAAGQARYVYLTDNTTESGTFGSLQFGTGTSSADASALAGSGLTNILGKLATSTEVIKTSNNIIFFESDRARTYVWTGGLGSATLPSISDIRPGWYVLFRNSGVGTVTFSPPTGKKINGNTTQAFFPTDSAIITCDYSTGNFFTVGLTKQNAVAYTAATYDVDSILVNTLDLTTFAPTIQTYISPSGARTEALSVTLPAITQLYVINNNTNSSIYTIDFTIVGSSQPPLSIANGVTALILTDSDNIYLLTQTSVNTFFAGDGTLFGPSYSFLSDTLTGLYLYSTNRMRAVSNGVIMLDFDATNLSDVNLSTPATFNAGLIGGGTF